MRWPCASRVRALERGRADVVGGGAAAWSRAEATPPQTGIRGRRREGRWLGRGSLRCGEAERGTAWPGGSPRYSAQKTSEAAGNVTSSIQNPSAPVFTEPSFA